MVNNPLARVLLVVAAVDGDVAVVVMLVGGQISQSPLLGSFILFFLFAWAKRQLFPWQSPLVIHMRIHS